MLTRWCACFSLRTLRFTEKFCTSWKNESACSHFWYCNWEGANGGVNKTCRPSAYSIASTGAKHGGGAKRGISGSGSRDSGVGSDPEHNCTAFGPLPTGTLEHHAHLLLPYANWYVGPAAPLNAAAERIATLMNRILQPWNTVSNMYDTLNYTIPLCILYIQEYIYSPQYSVYISYFVRLH